MSFRFPPKARIRDSAGFSNVFKKPAKLSDRNFTLLACANRCSHARLGLAISKRFAKKAVQRNRIKRLVRESFRHHQAELGGLDVVVLARQATAQASSLGLHASLQALWPKLIKRCAN